MTSTPNRLANAASPYLRSAAHQPIDWHEFGAEAFQLAEAQDKPILLDIGAVWCHWCHVIDRESYDDPEIGALINEHFVAIKVDRDERPDVDARYQKAVQRICGQGGWPLTAFLTFDGRVVYGGTYFPPEAMTKLLVQINRVYHERKAELFSDSDMLTANRIDAIEENEPNTLQASDDELAASIKSFLATIEKDAQRLYDPRYGGFGSQPKFPHWSGLQCLIAMETVSPEAKRRQMIINTLTSMANGGMYDQIAGGFHRYSVDAEWHVPHFEKMAYDNAEALKVCAQAYRLTNEPLFLELTQGILEWVARDLYDAETGAFFASQDADIDLEDDGDHFTWTLAEAESILSSDEARLVKAYYDLTSDGDMQHGPHPREGRNVLRIRQSLETVVHKLKLSVDVANTLLKSAKANMLVERQQRPTPFIDTSSYTHWNGMFIEACFEVADCLGLETAHSMAVKALERLLSDTYNDTTGFVHAVQETQTIAGTLEDQAWGVQALVRGFQSTGNQQYLSAAHKVMAIILNDYADTQAGGFNDTPNSTRKEALGLLKLGFKPQDDTPSSSATGITLQALQQLIWLSDEGSGQQQRYQASLTFHLTALVPNVQGHGLYASAIGVAAYRHQAELLKIDLVGSSQSTEFGVLQNAARSVLYPNKVLNYRETRFTESSTNEQDAPQALICYGTRCLLPINAPALLISEINRLTALKC